MAADARAFVFVLHFHQPSGNLEPVLEDAHGRCYRPVLELIARYPAVKVALHLSGALLEWLARAHPDTLETVRGLVERGQAELLGGGFYEPVLAALPDHDAAGQLEMMSLYLEKKLGGRPRGAWLAERAWDPDLPRLLAPRGLGYTLVDDVHFRAAGITAERVSGYYLTDKAGAPLAVFPIDRALRYAIPFRPVEAALSSLLEAPGEGCLTYADDVEKLGLWPKTHAWVWEEGWLERFFAALTRAAEDGRLRPVLPAAHLAEAPPAGRVHLPGGAYEELMRWALPPEAQRRAEALEAKLKEAGVEDPAALLRGGLWQGFLDRYPEANLLYRETLLVSARLQTAMEEAAAGAGRLEGELADRLGTAQRELYRAQGACPYWHGLFGGVYLPHLRAAARAALIGAEAILDELEQGAEDWLGWERADLDLDGREELRVGSRHLTLTLAPHRGLEISALAAVAAGLDLAGVVARHPEVYHREVEGEVPVDAGPRRSLADRLLPPEVDLPALKGGAADLGDFAGRPYATGEGEADAEAGTFRIAGARVGSVRGPSGAVAVRIEKALSMASERGALAVTWRVKNEGEAPLSVDFGAELNLTLGAGAALRLDEGPEQPMAAEGVDREVRRVALLDEAKRLVVQLAFPRAARLLRYPVETLTRTERGLASIDQGTCFVPTWHLELPPGASETLELALELGELPRSEGP